MFFKVGDYLLIGEVTSSSDTLQEDEHGDTNNKHPDHTGNKTKSQRGFLVTEILLKEVLEFIQQQLTDIKFLRESKGLVVASHSDASDGLDARIWKINSYVSEALWRKEVVSGLNYNAMTNMQRDGGELSICFYVCLSGKFESSKRP